MKDKIIQKVLKLMAQLILKKRKPKVVGITGSVGKTTTKEAVTKILKNNFRVRSNFENYNNEVGVPLTILGCKINYSRNKIFQIGGVFYYWLRSLFFDKNYPEILVLEMGADKPGDIKYFCDFIPITVGVLTDIGISHLENFKSKAGLIAEKGYLLRSIEEKGMAVYNQDNKIVCEVGEKLSVNTISYGLNKEAKMKASDIILKVEISKEKQQINGTNFKLNYQGKVLPIHLENCVGESFVYSVLAGLSTGLYFDLNLIEMIESLKGFKACSGRVIFKKGLNGSVIIDDSYNSAPSSLELALGLLKKIKAERKIVVLGDMLELGEEEEKSHRKIGREVAEINPDFFIAVGSRMEEAQKSYSKKIKNPENVLVFENSLEARNFVYKIIQPGDLILVKGSRGVNMEKIVEKLEEN